MGQSCPKGTDAVGCASRPQLVENELLYKKKKIRRNLLRWNGHRDLTTLKLRGQEILGSGMMYLHCSVTELLLVALG